MMTHCGKRQWQWLLAFTVLCLGQAGYVQSEPLAPGATNVWRFEVNSGLKLPLPADKNFNTSSSTPAIAPDGTVYIGSFYGTFFAVNQDGRERWRFQAGREIHSSPAIADDGTIYFGSRDRNCYALTPDGKLKWTFATQGWVDSSPAIAMDGMIYFGSWDKSFYALNPNGSMKWKFTTGAIVDSSPAIAADGTVYFGSHDNFFYALNPDGSLRWKFKTGGGIVSSPAIGGDGAVCFSSLDGNLYLLNPDGTERWHYHTGGATASSPVIGRDGNICIGLNLQTCLVSREGKELGRLASPMPPDTSVSAAAVPGRFYYAGHWRSLLAGESPGRELWKTDLDDKITSSVTVDATGTIYVCGERTLYALRPSNAAPQVGNSPWPMFRANARHTGRVNAER